MRFGLVSDLHWMVEPPTSRRAWHGSGDFVGVLARLRQALEHFAEQGAGCVVVGGDLVHRGETDAMAEVMRTLGEASAPVLLVSGNHDVTGDPDRLRSAIDQATDRKLELAAIDGIERDGLRIAGVQVGQTKDWFHARLREIPATGAWGSRPLVLVSHYPVLSLARRLTAAGFRYPGDLLDRQPLAHRLVDHRAPVVVLSGHVHARATVKSGTALQLSAGALVEPPYECAIVDIDAVADGSIVVRRRCQRLLAEWRAREPVFVPDDESWRFDGDRWINGAVRS